MINAKLLVVIIHCALLFCSNPDKAIGPFETFSNIIWSADTTALDLCIREGSSEASLVYHDNAFFLGSILYKYPDDNEAEHYDVPSGTTAIFPHAFYGNYYLKTISIPSSVFYIGSEAFSQSDKLENVELPEGLMFIGISAFEGASEITEIKLPESLIWIGSCAFYGCSIERDFNIRLPRNLMYIGENIFRDGTSYGQEWTPVYEVYEGSYAHEWVLQNDVDGYLIIDEQAK